MGKMMQNMLRGVGSLLEIQPAPRQPHFSDILSQKTDAEALYDDWQRIGEDIAKATGIVTAEGVPHDTEEN